MKKTYLVFVVIVVLLVPIGMIGCDFRVAGSGNLQTKDFDLGKFDTVDARDFFDIDIGPGDTCRVSVTIDDNIFNYLSINVNDGTLSLGLEECRTFRNVTLKAKITMPYIERLILSSGATSTLVGFNGEHDLQLKLSGFSSLNIKEMVTSRMSVSMSNSKIEGEITTDDAVLNVSDFSNIRLRGSAGNISATALDSSHMELASFPSHNAHVSLRNFSSASLSLSGRLDVQLRQNSSLFYTGSPLMGNIDIDGLSRMLHK